MALPSPHFFPDWVVVLKMTTYVPTVQTSSLVPEGIEKTLLANYFVCLF